MFSCICAHRKITKEKDRLGRTCQTSAGGPNQLDRSIAAWFLRPDVLITPSDGPLSSRSKPPSARRPNRRAPSAQARSSRTRPPPGRPCAPAGPFSFGRSLPRQAHQASEPASRPGLPAEGLHFPAPGQKAEGNRAPGRASPSAPDRSKPTRPKAFWPKEFCALARASLHLATRPVRRSLPRQDPSMQMHPAFG